jgi:hypothetical protein
MATRIYLVPKVGSGASQDDALRPKYVVNADLSPTIAGRLDWLHYGLEPVFLVAANVTAGEHAALVAHGDVVSVPASLDVTVGANLAAVKTALETLGVPCQWVVTGTTYRAIVRVVTQLMLLAQRLEGAHQVRLLPAGITLDSTVGDLSATQRQRMADTITSLGGTFDGVTLATTMRAAVKGLADQLSPLATLLDVTL